MNVIFALAGPSGSGKTELAARVMKLYPDSTTKWRQVTTRKRRNAADDYVFITREQYAALGGVLTCRTEFGGNLYGTIPEVTAEDVAIFTIVDINGITDLRRDVEEHNRLAESGKVGKFGASPIGLFTGLMKYELSEESVAERGRAERGVSFAESELSSLSELGGWDLVIDTTGGNWPDPVKFFNEQVWPRISTNPLAEAVKENVAVIESLVTAMAANTSLPTMQRLRSILRLCMAIASDDPNYHYAELIASRAIREETERRGAVDAAPGSLGADNSFVDVPPAPSALLQEEDDLADAIVGEEPAPLAEVSDAVELREEVEIRDVSEPVKKTEEQPIEEAEEQPKEEAPKHASPTALSVMDENSFEDWVIEDGAGISGVASEAAFQNTFKRYLADYGASLEGVDIGYGKEDDGRGGVVSVLSVTPPGGTTRTFRFNMRVKRFV